MNEPTSPGPQENIFWGLLFAFHVETVCSKSGRLVTQSVGTCHAGPWQRVGALPREGLGFVPRWWRGSHYVARLSVPGSVYFLVHPQVQGKWKANRGLSDRRNATCAATARLLKDGREFRCSTLFIDLPKTRCFGGRITQVGFLTPPTGSLLSPMGPG